jgi:hypothetical protein
MGKGCQIIYCKICAGGGEKREAHGRITRASLQMTQFVVYLRDHLLIDKNVGIHIIKPVTAISSRQLCFQIRRDRGRRILQRGVDL